MVNVDVAIGGRRRFSIAHPLLKNVQDSEKPTPKQQCGGTPIRHFPP
jgi:hypothetical protein